MRFLQDILSGNVNRKRVEFIVLYIIVTLISFSMVIVNIFTKRYFMMAVCMVFCITTLINIALSSMDDRLFAVSKFLFAIQVIVLFLTFIIIGEPDGFSVNWLVILPMASLLIYGRRDGTVLSVLMFFLLIFFFWTPYGQAILHFEYNSVYLMRYPLVYISCLALSYYTETLRMSVQSKLEESNKLYHRLYRHDELTGLYNRYGFKDRLLLEGDKHIAYVFIMDIDFFKLVNDDYGHDFGDIVLKHIAMLSLETLGDRGLLSRWGGEEFVGVVWDDVSCLEEIREKVGNSSIGSKERSITVTVSIGAVYIDTHSNDVSKSDIEDFVKKADEALYTAKNNGRNRVEIID